MRLLILFFLIFTFGSKVYGDEIPPHAVEECTHYINEKGNQNAAIWNNRGVAFATGKKGLKNDAEAYKWLSKAAGQNDPVAQNNLGLFYASAHEYQKSFLLFQQAAEQGFSEAQINLGTSYRLGYGVKQDYKVSFNWYQKAANQHNRRAPMLLGIMFRDGLGVTKNLNEATKLFLQAANQGDVDATVVLAAAYLGGYGVPQSYSESAKWYLKAVKQGDVEGQITLCYLIGKGVLKNNVEAVSVCRQAAKNGNAQAQSYLGWALHKGKGIKQNDTEALYWLKESIGKGDPMAEMTLGLMYYDMKNGKEAVRWFRKSAEQRNLPSQEFLALMYLAGEAISGQVGVDRNISKGILWSGQVLINKLINLF